MHNCVDWVIQDKTTFTGLLLFKSVERLIARYIPNCSAKVMLEVTQEKSNAPEATRTFHVRWDLVAVEMYGWPS